MCVFICINRPFATVQFLNRFGVTSPDFGQAVSVVTCAVLGKLDCGSLERYL